MNIEGFEFVHICKIEPERDADGFVVSYMPQARYANVRGLPLHGYGNGPFCRYRIPGSHRTSGVYAYVVDEAPMYLGRCENLSSRINIGYGNISPKNCFSGGQQANCRLNNLIHQAAVSGSTIDLHFHQTADFVAVEAALLLSARPPWNLR